MFCFHSTWTIEALCFATMVLSAMFSPTLNNLAISSSTTTNNNCCRRRRPSSSRSTSRSVNSIRVRASSSNKDKDDAPAFNPFGFVTDNPSSRSAIQLPEIPAEDGNVGQMLNVCNLFCFLLPYVSQVLKIVSFFHGVCSFLVLIIRVFYCLCMIVVEVWGRLDNIFYKHLRYEFFFRVNHQFSPWNCRTMSI